LEMPINTSCLNPEYLNSFITLAVGFVAFSFRLVSIVIWPFF
jgi:hypothetical protein